MAKELGFDELGSNRRTVQDDQRSRRSSGILVDSTSRELLAGPRLSIEQDIDVATGDALEDSEDPSPDEEKDDSQESETEGDEAEEDPGATEEDEAEEDPVEEEDEAQEDPIEEEDPDIDDPATYEGYLEELRGESPSEELDAWDRYLEVYPGSLYRLEIERRMDALEEIFARGDDALAVLRNQAEKDLSLVLGVRARVEIVPSDTIPRTDFKARRVIDDRDLFESLMGGGRGK